MDGSWQENKWKKYLCSLFSLHDFGVEVKNLWMFNSAPTVRICSIFWLRKTSRDL